MRFSERARALIGQYNDDIVLLREDSTTELFTKAFRKPTSQIKPTNIKKLRKGAFFIIKYNYNGNKLWCPIMSIEYKVIKNKNILYAINFDYLPYEYKIFFVNLLEKGNNKIFDKNVDIDDVLEEKTIPSTNFENVYKLLKNNGGKEYSITAFDILKIEKVYAVSTTILHRFIFLSTKYINGRLMLEKLKEVDDIELKEKMEDKIRRYEELDKIYEEDVDRYYRSLKNFEQNLKLYD